ncbi:MAG: hypothetical protein RLZZ312_2016 [Bacteroidota bacterium]|jgi:hypothetical protein
MKAIIQLFFVLITISGCNAQKNLDNTIFEYIASTRGYYQKILVHNQSIAVSIERNAKEMPVATKISKKDWLDIGTAFKKINIENLPNLVAPSEERHTDKTAFASLKITQGKKEYQSAEFDNGNAPAEIAKLVNKITKLAQKIQAKK